jgi:hypothetical protein
MSQEAHLGDASLHCRRSWLVACAAICFRLSKGTVVSETNRGMIRL